MPKPICNSSRSLRKGKSSWRYLSNGFYKYEEFKNVEDEFGVFKVGRATGLTLGKLLPIDSAISIDLTNESIKFVEKQGEQGQIPPHNNNDYKEIFIKYMKSPLIQ